VRRGTQIGTQRFESSTAHPKAQVRAGALRVDFFSDGEGSLKGSLRIRVLLIGLSRVPVGLGRPSEEGFHRCDRGVDSRLDLVSVVLDHARVDVAEQVGDLLDRNAGRRQQGRGGVAQAPWCPLADTGCAAQGGEGAP